MKKKHDLRLIFSYLLIIILALLFVIKFAGERFLKMYIEAGVGNCKNVPVLCMEPEKNTLYPSVDEDYINTQLIAYQFPKIKIKLPNGFNVVQELKKKIYYKRHEDEMGDFPIVYLLHQDPGFFLSLYPQLKKEGINDNYDFIKKMMETRLDKMRGLTDAFFIIMKGIFTPNLGNEKNLTTISFQLKDLKGFINYNLQEEANFFDCDIINSNDDFFKVYIKDKNKVLDLDKLFSVISTVKANN